MGIVVSKLSSHLINDDLGLAHHLAVGKGLSHVREGSYSLNLKYHTGPSYQIGRHPLIWN